MRVRLVLHRLRLRFSEEYTLAELNQRYLARRAIADLSAANEARHDTQDVVLLLVAAMFHHHISATLTLIRSALWFDATVCARCAIESLYLYTLFSHDAIAARSWFDRGATFSPAEVRKKVALPPALAVLYKQMCDYSHPNFDGAVALLSRRAPRRFDLALGPNTRADVRGLLRIVIVATDELFEHIYHTPIEQRPPWLRRLRSLNEPHRLLPLPLPRF